MRKSSGLLLSLAGVGALAPTPSLAAAERFALQSDLDHVWTMIAAGLVFFMQVGFLLLESGLVRRLLPFGPARRYLVSGDAVVRAR